MVLSRETENQVDPEDIPFFSQRVGRVLLRGTGVFEKLQGWLFSVGRG